MRTKADRAGSDTTGSGMLNSLRKDHGKQLTYRMDHASLKWDAVRELMPSQSRLRVCPLTPSAYLTYQWRIVRLYRAICGSFRCAHSLRQ